MARAPLSAYRVPRSKRRVPRPAQPDGMRIRYFADLRDILSRAHALVLKELGPLLAELAPEDRKDARFDADSTSRIRRAVRRIADKFAEELPPRRYATLTRQVAKATSDFQRNQLITQVKAAIGIDPIIRDEKLAESVSEFVKTNVELIKTLPETYFKEVEERVTSRVREGMRASEIAGDLEERYGVTESRARLIANDQVGKFYGELNDTRYQELGVTRAVWRTVRDNRVRETHQDLEGQSYELGVGLEDPQTGETVIPGQAINCRCYGEPDIEALLGGGS